MLSELERIFVASRRVAHLATADRQGIPHVVPVCFALSDITLYISIDEKPKRPGARLKRLRNIAENPSVALVVDHYEEDWSRLAWVMLHGEAEVLNGGTEHDQAQAQLRAKYAQLRSMQIEQYPVIAIRIARAVSWGDLSDRQSG